MAQSRASFLARLAASGPFGFGASSLGNLYRELADEPARHTVDAAWEAGIRYFDTAPFYGFGLSERRLGDALRARPRDEYLLSTKAGRLLFPGESKVPGESEAERFGFRSPMPFDPVFDYSYDGVMRSFEASLQRLGLARIDILYMHDIGRATHGDNDAWHFRHAVEGGFRALADLRDQGLIAAIGLGVNEIEVCERSMAHADFDLFMVAGRYTLLDQGAAAFFDTCRHRGIGVVAAGVFNSGILATGSAGSVVHFDYDVASEKVIRRVSEIEAICRRFDVALPAAALQFVAAHPAVTLPVIGTGSPSRIGQTVELACTPIPSAFWEALGAEGLIPSEVAIPA